MKYIKSNKDNSYNGKEIPRSKLFHFRQDLALFCTWLTDTFSETVINIEIDNGKRASVYMPMSQQVEKLCQKIYSYALILSVPHPAYLFQIFV